MPLYEYRCETCGGTEELLESFSAPSQHDCSQCGAAAGMRRQISVAAFNLSGDGWYAQGYSGGKKPGTAKDTSAGASNEAPAASSSGCCSGCPHKHGA